MRATASLFRQVLHNPLWMASCFSMCLLLLRMIWQQNSLFVFLVWNLFLAAIPFFISYFLLKKQYRLFSIQALAIQFIYILFLPNAAYLLTDLIHYRYLRASMWLDLIMLFSFAISGLAFFFFSLAIMKNYWRQHIRKAWQLELLCIGILFSSSIGVYIGRFKGWNSWDLFIYPIAIVRDLLSLFHKSVSRNSELLFIICFFGLLCFLYLLLKSRHSYYRQLLSRHPEAEKKALRSKPEHELLFKPRRVLSKSFFDY